MIVGHHPSAGSLLVELAVVAALVVLFGAIAWQERRRRAGRGARRSARMRDVP
jgi:hypothetical protein